MEPNRYVLQWDERLHELGALVDLLRVIEKQLEGQCGCPDTMQLARWNGLAHRLNVSAEVMLEHTQKGGPNNANRND